MQALVREISGPDKSESVDSQPHMIPSETDIVFDTNALQPNNGAEDLFIDQCNSNQESNDKKEKALVVEITADNKPKNADFGEVIVNVSKLVVRKKTVLGEYSGGMRDGEWHGQGRLTGNTALGHVLEGHFSEGDLVSGEGVVALRTGTVLQGTWVERILHGPGKIVTPLGQTQEGVFERGVLLASDMISYTSSGTGAGKTRVNTRMTTKTVMPALESNTNHTGKTRRPRKSAQENASQKEGANFFVYVYSCNSHQLYIYLYLILLFMPDSGKRSSRGQRGNRLHWRTA